MIAPPARDPQAALPIGRALQLLWFQALLLASVNIYRAGAVLWAGTVLAAASEAESPHVRRRETGSAQTAPNRAGSRW